MFKTTASGGNLLEHPYSVMMATPVITAQFCDWLINSLKHFDEFGECLFCGVLEQGSERRDSFDPGD